VYRFYEIVQAYGSTIKELIHDLRLAEARTAADTLFLRYARA
jgi:cyanate lyase